MRAIFIPLCCLAMLATGCVAQSGGVRCDQAPASRAYFKTPPAEQTMDDILANLVKCLSDDGAVVQADNIGANTSDAMHATLAALYRNDAPDSAALAAMGADLNQLLRPKEDRFKHTTLLNEAVRQQNYVWLLALLDAGADPNGSGSLMAYTAATDIFHPSSPWNHLFRDGSPAVPFLQAYLDHGGVVNTTGRGGFGNIPLLNDTFNNLAARVFLLENGADGWLVDGPVDRLSFSGSTFGGRVFGSLAADYNEEMYLLIQRDLFQMPRDAETVQLVHDSYLFSLEDMTDASGPTDRHRLWTLQKVVGALIAKGFIIPGDRITALLRDNAVPDTEGGWVLSQGQLHQAFDDTRAGAVLGTQVW